MNDEEFLAEIERRSKTFTCVFLSRSEVSQLYDICSKFPSFWGTDVVDPTLPIERWSYMLSNNGARNALRNHEIALAAIVADTLTK